jgi:hypothetical protein
MAHGHHWAIRPRQLDVCSRANKHAARRKLFHASAVEYPCHRQANTLCQLATRLQSGPKRWPASQPISHRRRPVEVAIFIADGNEKYQWTDHALMITNLLVCRSCSERACGLCRPLACLMAWAPRKVGVEQSCATWQAKPRPNPTSPTGALFRTPPVPCAFLVIRALALPSAKLPGYRPQAHSGRDGVI